MDSAKLLNSAISSGCRYLAIREHSEKQLQMKLLKKGYCSGIISDCIDYLKKENWLCEERFCNAFIRSRSEKGQGWQRIEYELRQQNISQSVIQQQQELEDIDWQKNCVRVLNKKYSLYQSQPYKETAAYQAGFSHLKDKRKLENFLKFRGFSADEIKKAFMQLVRTQ